jgi:lipopolysaccharide transport system permease protein
MVSSVDSSTRLDRPRPVKVIVPPSFSPSRIVSDLKRLVEYFDLLLTLTHHRIRVRYKQSALGIVWALLQPLALMLIYTVIFSVVTRVPTEGVPYAIFVYAALLPWTFFSSTLTTAVNCLVSHNNLITKVYFPREILPLTYLFAAGFDLIVASLVLAAMLVYYHILPGMVALWAAPILLIAAGFSTAMALLFSAGQVWFRDIGLAMPLALQLWMFASPVVYPLSAVPARFRTLYILNPMVGVTESFRRVLLQNQLPDFESLEVSAIITLILLIIAYLFFKNREATMADVI